MSCTGGTRQMIGAIKTFLKSCRESPKRWDGVWASNCAYRTLSCRDFFRLPSELPALSLIPL